MINFPVLESIEISDYGLYPGQAGKEGLHVSFQAGLTLVLGTNGLGKTTLITILFRLLTGTYDISGITDRNDLGNNRLIAKPISSGDKRIFAQRVVDNARNAKARLNVRLGKHSVMIERRLNDLGLTKFVVDGIHKIVNEEYYQDDIARMVGVWSFGDWILLVRHLVFYFEDRRSLVWDPTAQRQILRMLFLSTDVAKNWTERERAILELDTRMRNLSTALFREERALSENEVKIDSSSHIREELRTLQLLQSNEIERREYLENNMIEIERTRDEARLRLLRAEQQREARYRAVEHIKLAAINTRFPDRSETARYILAQLLTEQDCLVCGSHVPTVALEYASRIESKLCVVCGTDLSDTDQTSIIDDEDYNRTLSDLEESETDVNEARLLQEATERQYQSHVEELTALSASISDRSSRIDFLVRRLPPDESEMHQQRADLVSMRGRLESMRRELSLKREEFGSFVDVVNQELVKHSEGIKAAFDRYAEGFLLEQCKLVWSPRKATLGQGGDSFNFPAFEFDMTGADFPSPVRRTGPDQVSESQREFIDLAFRMALIEVGGNDSIGTLVIDAPESSLDAVFASRAAIVLSRFARPSQENRLVVTSNLVEGKLIPSLIANAIPLEERESRIIDLVSVAAPTAAVRILRDEYAEIRDNLLSIPALSATD